ncbi:NADPH:quinone reductase [Kitasatospora sp. NE20-6]|uniref:NAD(P)-dependent alcohol dehydrogenase n=1 Tax=Kitasatospora sp. NE20-6 TaxID=2859066 RepID=UPI0034DBBCCD
MKAIVQDGYGEADVLRLREVDRPSVGDDDVLVRVGAAGVDRGVWHIMTGLPYPVRAASGLRRPRNPVRGTDVAGQVAAVGRNVTRFRPGDAVYGSCNGSFAEYALARQDRLAPTPAGLSDAQAAAIPVSAVTALRALRDAGRIRPGRSVLVIGAGGGVGSFAVQLARALGAASVTGVCSTAKTELVRSLGADDVVDHTRTDVTDGTRTWDLVIDTGGNRPLARLRRALTPKGTLVIVGGEGGGRWFQGLGRQLAAPMVSLVTGQRLCSLLATVGTADLEHLTELVEAGRLTPAVDRTYPLERAADAVRHLQEGRALGKLVVTVRATG